eukprot:TRINITY_DN1187_c0_g1_i1.p1 TRINITY_DN1187_c0_g1~~TRINITY_DN1187_c0_g1_i1.p1  ORF type:complete len:519 (+),score=174.02 TRINITY_DN1187_c0_g1_i1:1346-2902(+)
MSKIDAAEVKGWATLTREEGRKLYSADDEDISDDDDYDDDYGEVMGDVQPGGGGGGSGPNKQPQTQSTMQPTTHNKVWSKINTDSSHSASKSVAAAESIHTSGNIGHSRDKSERATTEQVMDPRTRIILFKLVNAGWLDSINGCVSTGKEANVYHASGKEGLDYAIKVYKTSILVFKDRDKYVSGEYRFRKGYCKSNPRKMVRTWAEKECRNLKRLYQAGIPCPSVEILRQHVLVMSFIGKNGWPAPRLKDANISAETARSLYVDLIKMMRTMFHTCHLVHADLSEFNILYMNHKLYIIDVSQSVEHDHPHALDFLRKDVMNVTDWFRNKGLLVMRVPELFTFVIDSSIGDNVDEYLDMAMERIQARTTEQTAQEKIDEEVFKNLHLPRSFSEIGNIEAWQKRIERGDADRGVIDAFMTRSVRPEFKNEAQGEDKEKDEGEEEEEEEEDEDEDEEDEEDDQTQSKTAIYDRKSTETTEEKRERKKAVKQMQSEKRKIKKEKLPKHLKKRKEKQNKGKK